MNAVWIAHEFYRNSETGVKIYSARPRVWYGKHAKTEIDKWIKDYSRLNGFTDVEPEDFMDRLIVKIAKFDWQKLDKQYFEIYAIEGDYFNNDCTRKRN